MSQHQTDTEDKALPQPVALTPEQVQQVAAGTAAVLPPCCLKPPVRAGGISLPE
jgi:hypothetical protein